MKPLSTLQSTSVPLIIRSVFPDYYQGRIAINSNVVITFSEAITAGSGFITIKNSKGQVVLQESVTSPNITISGAVLTFNPAIDFEFASNYFIELSTGIVTSLTGLSYQSYGSSVASFSTEFSNVAMNITGTAGDDIIYGSTKEDVINGGAGRDQIQANEGDDIVNGGDESSSYFDGDTIYGGSGNDILHGNAGSDLIYGDAGDDKIYGDSDHDRLFGGAGNDELDGGAGGDTLEDSDGNNVLRGGDGNDTLNSFYSSSLSAFNLLDGGAGNDNINAGGADDVTGGDGNDVIRYLTRSGSSRNATVDGGSGNDRFNLSFNDAVNTINLKGGAGSDTFAIENYAFYRESNFIVDDFTAGKNGDQIDLANLLQTFSYFNKNPFALGGFVRLKQDGQNTLLQAKSNPQSDAIFYTILTLKNITLSQLSADNFTGGFNPDGSSIGVTLVGTENYDVLRGNLLDDHIFGGSGPDLIYGGKGNDTLVGGDENSFNDSDTIYGDAGNDILKGGAGNDSLNGGEGDDTLEGGSGNDYLSDSFGYNLIRGQDGDDQIFIDSIDGGIFEGGNGNDKFEINAQGKVKNVSISGGVGADIYILRNSNVGDVKIKDFSVSDADSINLNSLLPNVKENPFGSTGFLKVTQEGGNVILFLDDDGAAGNAYAMHPILTLENIDLKQLNVSSFVGGWNPNGSNEGVILRGTVNNDILTGSDLNDTIYGDAGTDAIRGGKGDDQLFGDDGIDSLYGDNGDDVLNGGLDNDYLDGGEGNDVLDGGAGNDNLRDDFGKNILRGGAGNDVLYSNGLGSTVDGGDGNDEITTSGGGDAIFGGAGNDTVRYGGWRTENTNVITSIELGDGDDVLKFDPTVAESKVNVRGGNGVDSYQISSYVNNGLLTISDFQTGLKVDVINLFDLLIYNNNYKGGNPFGTSGMFRLVQKGSDTIIEYDPDGSGSSLNSSRPLVVLSGIQSTALNAANFGQGLNPNGGEDGLTLRGGIGEDILNGGLLNDRLYGDAGNDRLDGGRGNDQLFGGDGQDLIIGGLGNDILNGDSGNDQIYEDHLTGDNQLNGGSGNDDLRSSSFGKNLLNGGDGNDSLRGGSGSDVLNGEDGDDTISIYLGSDNSQDSARQVIVNGGNGHDKITILSGSTSFKGSLIVSGGKGIDTFNAPNVVNNTPYTVTDFSAGPDGDYIDLNSGYYYYFNDKNPFGEIGFARLQQRGQDTIVQIDADGPTGLRQFQDVLILQGVQATSLTAANFIGAYSPDGIDQGMVRNGDEQNDILTGTQLNDTLNGGAGDDKIDGGLGNDQISGGLGNDELSDGGGDNTFFGGSGDDKIFSTGDGFNHANGGSGDDSFVIYACNGTFSGDEGNDTFNIVSNYYSVGSRYIALNGGSGEDQFTISGVFDGNLTVNVNGGPDADLFIPRYGYSSNTFNAYNFDTTAGGDKISLNPILNDMNYFTAAKGNPFANGYLSFQQSGSDTVLMADSDGTGPISSKVILNLKNFDVNLLNQNHIVELFDLKGGSAGFEKVGDSADNQFVGGWTKDNFSGLGGNDLLSGQGGNDLLDGGAGNDTLIGGAGDDDLIGGAGLDTAVYTRSLSDYKFTKTSTGFKVEDKYYGNNGVDNLSGVEFLQFSDIKLNLTVKEKAALIAAADVKMLIELYVAFFNRTPDADGIAYWIDEFKNGQTISQISESFYNIGASEQYSALTGFTTSMTNDDFIHTFYRNVLGRKDGADEGGLSYWVNKLTTGASSRSSLAQDILNSAHTFKGDADFGYVADLLDNKYFVGKTVAIDWGVNFLTKVYERGVDIAAAVTSTHTTYALSLVGVPPEEMNFF
jgi:Ca2+-binding RTX toxin-like protein